MHALSINTGRLMGRIQQLGTIGRDAEGRLARTACSDADKAGRDMLAGWITDAGLELAVDRIGNIFGLWKTAGNARHAPVLVGSHIDTVIDAGIFDGCYGVLAGLEVIQTLREAGFVPPRPIAVAAFTNEEGVRYAPDMMGSLVHAGGLPLEQALATVGTDGSILGAELERIGYAGTEEPGFLQPHAYIELHIEQGPILEREEISVGAVENLQGISWHRITIDGEANHAGTTPMSMRRDAGHAAAAISVFVHDRAAASTGGTVATVGCIRFEPNAINVIPSRATMTVDLRDPDATNLAAEEGKLAGYLETLSAQTGVTIATEQLARFDPVIFDAGIVACVEAAAAKRGLSTRRMTSGAGHDAQMMARITAAGMIFVPSRAGVSHNPGEFTEDAELAAGANVLLDVVMDRVNT
ncbi:allantoate amidohydrolase [Pararhizobium polonicum]|uniref:Allantoate amidohydrolase n=1 Tax=Pararhizobium polonicum TaxID=1612624 RepID=A0A1C7NZV8_9HYPH|nr:Zn-dependent hydrolase [Pararhizobium polonicum]OBZ94551.1 allantoate amidohydrolase [Pararhizobium polonicum]